MEGTAAPCTDISSLPNLTGQISGNIDNYVAAGGFGSVYQCDWRRSTSSDSSPVKVAVKVIRCSTSEEDKVILRRLRREAGIWAYLVHENIVPFYGMTEDFGPFPALVSLWFSHGTLHRLIADKGTSLSTRSKLKLLHDIACGLDYLHSFPIVHGDLTSSNVLVDGKGGEYQACLTDFGLSTVLGGLLNDPAVEPSNVRHGAYRWTAPELLRPHTNISPTEKNDMYSFGRVMFHVLTLLIPWNGLDHIQVHRRLLNGEEIKRPQIATSDLTDTRWNEIELCWSVDTSARPSASMAMTFLMSELLTLTDDRMEDVKKIQSLSFPNNVTDVKSTLDSDATRRPKKAAVPRSIPLAFFDEMRDHINPPMTATNPPPAAACVIPPPTAAGSDLPATTPADPPPSRHRLRNILTSFPLSGARAYLHRALPLFRYSRPNTSLFTDLPEQHSSQPLVSIHGPTNVEVLADMDNQLDATPRLAQDERHPQSLPVDAQDRIYSSTSSTHSPPSEYHRRHAIAPSSRSSTHPLLGRISERFRGSHPNTDESTELQEIPTPDHETAIVEVPLAHDKQPLYVARRKAKPKPVSGKKDLKYDKWWARCILFVCCVPIPERDGNEGGNVTPVTDVEHPAENPAEPTSTQTT